MPFYIRLAKSFIKKHERWVGPVFLVGGFIIDNLTLTRIDQRLDNAILLTYLLIVTISILVLSRFNLEGLPNARTKRITRIAFLAMQFAFGGLFSGYFVFYSRSSSVATSWFFLLLLVALMVGNEFLQRVYKRQIIQLVVLYVAIFSYAIFFLPVVFKRLGAGMFIASGLVSLALMAGISAILRKISPVSFAQQNKQLIVSVLTTYVLFNILYFTNIIPPVPLSIKSSDVYFRVDQNGRSITGTYEKLSWYKFYARDTMNITGNQGLAFFSSVFAPTDISSTIYHRWSYFNKETREWVQTSRVSLRIVGGRDAGYRTYSRKGTVFPGKWRVDVITERNQIIGRDTFVIKEVSTPVPTVTEEL